MEDIRRAVLEWNRATTLTASLEEGWIAPEPSLAEILNRSWPLRDRALRPGDDLLGRVVREVARVFNARILELGRRAGHDAQAG